MTSVVIGRANGLHGSLTIPGDKSISHCSVIFGSISKGKTVINHFLKSADCLCTIKAFQQMGVKIASHGDQVVINSQGIDHLHAPKTKLQMGNSGTTTRLITGLLSGQPFNTTLVGDASLSKRPMKRISVPLNKMGAKVKTTRQGTLPLEINGGQKLHGINYVMPVASAQVKSSIILAAIQASTPTKITEPIFSRDHTERMLKKFSPNSIKRNGHDIVITPHQAFTSQTIDVPGDISSAAYFMVAGAIVPDSEICLKNVGVNPTRTGLIKVMKQMGANIQLKNLHNRDSEPAADIIVKSSKLHPCHITGDIIPALIDEVPLVALLGACADGVTKVTGAQELRYKESNRLATTTEELQKMGVKIKELPDGFVIDGSQPWQSKTDDLDSHNDHRIAMMLAVAALIAKEPVKIHHADSIRISYPTFFKDLKKLENK
ncbi:3-phosphoshikimate 1-carboxyvinyltransferase [Acetilactobacillus jinshanensis]|uniref:3-phosphoshikimate 1-carboxyvinyltransferase n=1 Tax=Acetilactobacillus jinshanensis TaxID=1720083 RepID=A0A4P6ZLB2_9LACO|nr:3-phosphoshikimate 1-carboxyvinyltransferase [Acetilactobacillus jinshanensis]QBP18317.1 3-phosphoshikimate 1-carboxyvinyltransferase [Acetilactobacillus jinshanensis]URL61182.1 3-phosphoshikimate 1-carboxyvinyltransferase [uncultured bacterium]